MLKAYLEKLKFYKYIIFFFLIISIFGAFVYQNFSPKKQQFHTTVEYKLSYPIDFVNPVFVFRKFINLVNDRNNFDKWNLKQRKFEFKKFSFENNPYEIRFKDKKMIIEFSHDSDQFATDFFEYLSFTSRENLNFFYDLKEGILQKIFNKFSNNEYAQVNLVKEYYQLELLNETKELDFTDLSIKTTLDGQKYKTSFVYFIFIFSGIFLSLIVIFILSFKSFLNNKSQ